MTTPNTEQIWITLATDLRGYLARRIADPVVVEDLLQEVFVRVHAKLGELREGSRVAPWVFRIARNVAVDHLRARGRTPLPDALLTLAAIDANEDGTLADDALARRALATWLAAMVDTLEPPYAEAVRLADLEGMSQAQAAGKLGLSHSGFKSRVQRGRAQLRGILDACCRVELDVRGGLIDYEPVGPCC